MYFYFNTFFRILENTLEVWVLLIQETIMLPVNIFLLEQFTTMMATVSYFLEQKINQRDYSK